MKPTENSVRHDAQATTIMVQGFDALVTYCKYDIDKCAYGIDIAVAKLQAVKNQTSDLVVPDCMQQFHARFRAAMERYSQGLSTARKGISAHNTAMTYIGIVDGAGEEMLTQSIEILKAELLTCPGLVG